MSLHKQNIENALTYILGHIRGDIFWEYPPPGVRHFALKVTYWKDSVIPTGKGREAAYPVTYALAHFQAARAIIGAARILGRKDLLITADKMFKAGIKEFITDKAFRVMRDELGSLEQVSSDELHSLAYIPLKYKSRLPLSDICHRAQSLVTPAGFACTPKEAAELLSDKYHGYVVWPFEQAFINYGCLKFGLKKEADIARLSAKFIGTGQELINITPKIMPSGNDHQLWSVAAKAYFAAKTPAFWWL